MSDDNSWYENGKRPPVGTVCEVLNTRLHMHDWEKCTILFMGKYKCVYDSESCHERIGDVDSTGLVEFRPIKSEREIAIEEILVFIGAVNVTNEKIAAALYDAGYRKTA